MLRCAIQAAEEVSQMEGVPEETKLNLMYQRGQLGVAMSNLWWMIPTCHRSLAFELRRINEAEDMVDTNVDCLNSVIEDYHPALPMICTETEI